ncbi:MAG: hypothetical protein WB711_12995 [Terriglobales bacterium]
MTNFHRIRKRLKPAVVAWMVLVVISAAAYADQNGTCEMDGGRKAHYYCPDGFEVMLAGGGKEDCSGRCYKKGSAYELGKAIQDVLGSDFKWSISDSQAQKIAEEMMKSGASKTIKADDKSITLKAGKPND